MGRWDGWALRKRRLKRHKTRGGGADFLACPVERGSKQGGNPKQTKKTPNKIHFATEEESALKVPNEPN